MEIAQPAFSFIVVNFRSQEQLSTCLESIRRSLPAEQREIIVVNNDTSPLLFQDPEVSVVDAPRNLGFGAGVNLGARQAAGQLLFLINPDAELLAFPAEELFRRFRNDPDLGIIGGRIIGRDGETEPWSNGQEATLWRIILNNLPFWRRRLGGDRESVTIDWVSGGALVIPRKLFEKIGGFDENYFLYFEDMDLGKRVRQEGLQVLFFPGLVVRHRGGSSFSAKREQKKYFYASQEYYLKKHCHPAHSAIIKCLRKIFHPHHA